MDAVRKMMFVDTKLRKNNLHCISFSRYCFLPLAIPRCQGLCTTTNRNEGSNRKDSNPQAFTNITVPILLSRTAVALAAFMVWLPEKNIIQDIFAGENIVFLLCSDHMIQLLP